MQQRTVREIRRADVIRSDGRWLRVLDIDPLDASGVKHFTCEPIEGQLDIMVIGLSLDESIEVKS